MRTIKKIVAGFWLVAVSYGEVDVCAQQYLLCWTNTPSAMAAGGSFAISSSFGEFSNVPLRGGTDALVGSFPTPCSSNSAILLDTDGDGMPDSFELANGLDPNDASDASVDWDGDGLTNMEEYLAGTNPNNAASSLDITDTASIGADIGVSFNSLIGKNYRLERNDTSPAGPWTAVSDVAGTGATVQVLDPGGAAQLKRFYRVILLP